MLFSRLNVDYLYTAFRCQDTNLPFSTPKCSIPCASTNLASSPCLTLWSTLVWSIRGDKMILKHITISIARGLLINLTLDYWLGSMTINDINHGRWKTKPNFSIKRQNDGFISKCGTHFCRDWMVTLNNLRPLVFQNGERHLKWLHLTLVRRQDVILGKTIYFD